MSENQVICQIYINEATQHNAIRIGFSTYIEDEIVLLIGKLKKNNEAVGKNEVNYIGSRYIHFKFSKYNQFVYH